MMKEKWNRTVSFITDRFPHIKDEEIFWENYPLIERIFFSLINSFIYGYTRIVSSLYRDFKLEFPPNSLAKKLGNFIIILIFFLVISFMLLILPFSASVDSYEKTLILEELFFIVLSCSIAWTGYVYVIQEFRELIKTRIYPAYQKSNNRNFMDRLQDVISGTLFETHTRNKIRLFIISVIPILFYFLFFFPHQIGLMLSTWTSMTQGISDFYYIFLTFLVFILTDGLLIFLTIMLCAIMILTLFIDMILFFVVWDNQVEINPLIEMGGTEDFGKIIIHSLLVCTYAIAIFPIILILPQLNERIIQISHLKIQSIQSITILTQNFFTTIKETPFETVYAIISKYFTKIELFAIFLAMSFIIIFIIHVKIKNRKKEEISKLDNEISRLSSVNFDDNQKLHNLFYIKENISNQSTWPIDLKNVLIGAAISIVMLIISNILS